MSWNWKYECCLVFGGLVAGGPLGSFFYKTLERSLQPDSESSKYSHFFSSSYDGSSPSSSTLSLLVPSSLWFLVTTSCVGCFFWGLGEILRKLHSATTTKNRCIQARADAAAAAREEAERIERLEIEGAMEIAAGEGGEGQRGEGGRWRLEGEGLRGLAALAGGHDHNYQIHHFAGGRLIFPFLPHGRLRLWGISFL